MNKRQRDVTVADVKKRPRHYIDEVDFFARCTVGPGAKPFGRFRELPLDWLDGRLRPRLTAANLLTALTPLLCSLSKMNRGITQIVASYAASPETLVDSDFYDQMPRLLLTDAFERPIVVIQASSGPGSCRLMVQRPLSTGVHRFTVQAEPPVTRSQLQIGISAFLPSANNESEVSFVANNVVGFRYEWKMELPQSMARVAYSPHRSMTCELDLSHGPADGLIRFIADVADDSNSPYRTATLKFRRTPGCPVFAFLRCCDQTRLTVTLESSVYSG